MNKLVLILLCFAVSMNARENPFETVVSPLVTGKTTQIKENRRDFESATVQLPSSARILKNISLEFQNLDGSISEEIVVIEQNIDWHYPLILSAFKKDDTKKLQENALAEALPHVIDNQKNLKKVDNPPEIPFVHVVQEKNETLFKLGESVVFDINKHEIKIFTKDEKIRDFLVSTPYKVVIDFKKKNSFATKTVDFKIPPFVSATMGDHDGFYRIAILLDGQYRYDIAKIAEGYRITLK